jgi:hypothetical protein
VNGSIAPSGGSINYPNGNTLSSAVTITLADGTDAGPGVAASSEQLQRASATLTGITCGTFGGFSTVATDPAATHTDAGVATKTCYQYRYVVSDNWTATVTLGTVSRTGSGPGTGSGSVTVTPAASLNDFSGNGVDSATSATLARLF